MTQAIVRHEESTQLARPQGPLDFTPKQHEMIRDSYANGASESEFAVLMEIAKARRLNPLLKQVHFVSRDNNTQDERGNWVKKKVWTAQVSIDGMRAIAQRTGLYDGQDEPEFDDAITKCVVRVYRKDWSRPSVGVAHWDEYVQTKRDGTPSKFWQTMPRVMLSKCAESIALRKAFPEDMSGLYTPEEMQQSERPAKASAANIVHDAIPEASGSQPAVTDALTPELRASVLLERMNAATTRGELLEVWDDVNEAKDGISAEHMRVLGQRKDEMKVRLTAEVAA